MIRATCSVLAPLAGSTQSLSRSLSRLIAYPPKVLPPPIGSGCLHARSRPSIFQRPSSPASYRTVSCKKPFNTQ
jgi:hypothetical protein